MSPTYFAFADFFTKVPKQIGYDFKVFMYCFRLAFCSLWNITVTFPMLFYIIILILFKYRIELATFENRLQHSDKHCICIETTVLFRNNFADCWVLKYSTVGLTTIRIIIASKNELRFDTNIICCSELVIKRALGINEIR